MMSHKKEVIALYRCVFRLARNWENFTAQLNDAPVEKEYIRNEAKTLFRKNKNITDEELIKSHIIEAETRIEMAIHYRIPYPRPVNIPQNVLPPLSSSLKKAQKRAIKQSKPIYLKSYDDEEEGKT